MLLDYKQEFERLLKDDKDDFSAQIVQQQANRQFEHFHTDLLKRIYHDYQDRSLL